MSLGISATSAPVRPPVTPPGGPAAPNGTLPSSDAASGMRMAAPVFRTFLDLSENASVYRGMRDMHGGFLSGSYSSGGMLQGTRSTIEGGIRTLPKALSGSFVFSALMSGVTNLLELFRGQKSPLQALGGFCADTVAYTGIGATATMIGGLLGSFVPVLGTLIGVAAGAGISFLLGSLYEKHARPQLSATFTQSIQSLATPQSMVTPAPTPTP